MLEMRLLGQFELRIDGAVRVLPSRPAQSLLAYLALHAGTAHRRERLAGLLWPDHSDASARSNLRTALWHIRKVLGDAQNGAGPYILSDDITITFNREREYWLDASALQVAAGAECTSSELIELVALYRGELLPGFYEEWIVLERDRLEAVFDATMQRLLGLLLAEKRWSDALAWSGRWLAFGRAPEPAYRVLMTAHAALGDLPSVAEAYGRCRAGLREELGVEPSAATVTLYEALIRGESPAGLLPQILPGRSPQPALQPADTTDTEPAPGDPPFQGLRYFEEEDAGLFFGREALVQRLLARLEIDPTLLVVVGASGSGKSSLVRAGLIPALKKAWGSDGRPGSGEWQVRVITPTARPLETLALSLVGDAPLAVAQLVSTMREQPSGLAQAVQRLGRGTKDRVLLVVDQFEELFTLCEHEADRRALVDNLATATESAIPLTVVIAVRADFYAHCGQYPALREALAARQEYVGPMSADELRRAIEGPAQRGGWHFGPELVDLILRDTAQEPGSLPLLSHALLETWKRRQGRTLTLAGYAASGGVHGAIAHTAQWVYQGLAPAEQTVARNAFLRLTALGEGTQDTRRRVEIGELIPKPEAAPLVRKVLAALADARLITMGEDGVEVAHEALIREWPSLRRWLAEDRESLRLHRRLTSAAREWEGLGRDPSALYRGKQLEAASEWAEAHGERLNEQERQFLSAALTQAAGEAAEREAQRRREMETSRQLALAESRRAEAERRAAERARREARFLAAALVVTVLLAGAAAFLGHQARAQAVVATAAREQAEQQRRLAIARELAAAAVASLTTDPERSVLLAMQAVEDTYGAGGQVLPEALDALHRALPEARTRSTLAGHKGAVRSLAVSPDGRQLATLGKDGYLKLWNTENGQIIRDADIHPHEGGFDVAYSHDGALLATASLYEGVRIWSVSTGQELQRLQFPEDGSGPTAFGLSFSPDDRRLAVANRDHSTRIYDLSGGQMLLPVDQRGGDSQVTVLAADVAFSPDGKLLAVAYGRPWGPDNAAPYVQLLDAVTGKQVQLLMVTGRPANVNRLTFSPNGVQLATAADDHVARLWDVASGKLLRTYAGHTAEVEDVAFSPDGTQLATASLDGTARLWDVSSGRELLTLAGHTGGVLAVAFVPSVGGPRLATASADGTARIWDLGPSREWLTVGEGQLGGIGGLAFSPDGRRVAAVGDRHVAALWDLRPGGQTLLISLPEPRTGYTRSELPANLVAFSPDGKRLALSGSNYHVDYNTKVTVHDAATGQLLTTIDALTLGTTRSLAFSPDGAHLLTGNVETVASVWDLSTGQRQQVLAGHSGPINSVTYSPDGARIATGSDDGQVKLWDAATGLARLTLSDAHLGGVWAVAFSPDGKRIATAGRDGMAKVWDLSTGKVQLTLAGHIADVRSIAWSPDGKLLATGSGDTTAKVWDATTGAELYTLHGHTDLVSAVAFSPDGARLATASEDGTMRLSLVRVEDLLGLARSRVTRGLSADECRKYLHLDECRSRP